MNGPLGRRWRAFGLLAFALGVLPACTPARLWSRRTPQPELQAEAEAPVSSIKTASSGAVDAGAASGRPARTARSRADGSIRTASTGEVAAKPSGSKARTRPASTRSKADATGELLRIEVLDVGQGDAILIRVPEGQAALIDAGPSRAVVDELGRQGVTKIDLVAVSHHHTDHFVGMGAVLDAYKPRYYLATGTSHAPPTYLKLLNQVKDAGITAIEPTEKPREIHLGEVKLTVLPQPPEDSREENNNSIGIRVDYGKFSMLMTGDSEETQRAWWVKNCPELIRDCPVIKLAHHGSRNGTDP